MLKSWREVISPRPEVQSGVFRESDFAANLADAVKGKGSEGYSRADKFFKRTYITEGMRDLMFESLKRVTGHGGTSVIQLKTAFGGGKTHSMLALYHLMHGGFNAQRVPEIRSMLADLGMSALPRVNVAVAGGTKENPAESSVVNGITVNTMCGNIVAQLGGYEYVKEADRAGTSPGTDTLTEMFNACGPCLVLIDELAAYGSKLYNKAEMPAGTFETFRVFMQELTEAANSSGNSIVVAAMPDSTHNGGTVDGMMVFNALDSIFMRVASVWRPVKADEGFEIVIRRLFNECGDDSAREETVESFSRMYQENASDFPAEARVDEYKQKLLRCYPVHPEVFNRLYGEWSTLENFQRTRGVLQFMAAVIHDLWTHEDSGALIMPGSINAASSGAREQLTRALSSREVWNGIIDKEVDGPESTPCREDKSRDRYGDTKACRRVARTILLGSAPSEGAQTARGIEKTGILLGTVQPGENISVFTDALGTLRDTLTYLYTSESGNRLWFDTRPTLRRIVDSRAGQRRDSEVNDEIRKRLQRNKPESPFSRFHVWPEIHNVSDEQSVKIVVLPPRAGESEAQKILEAQTNKNMLVFLEADQTKLDELRERTRMYLAWCSVDRDRESLNLTTAQLRETQRRIQETDKEVGELIGQTWSSILVPRGVKSRIVNDVNDVDWKSVKVTGSEKSIQSRVFSSLKPEDKCLVDKWDAGNMSMELDYLVWDKQKDIPVKRLWENLCRYCYFPRLTGRDVLYAGIADGVKQGLFGLAGGKSGDEYTNLRLNESVMIVNDTDILVEKKTAERQIESEKQKEYIYTITPSEQLKPTIEIVPEPPMPRVMRRFTLSVDFDINTYPSEAKSLYEEILRCFKEEGAEFVKLRLEAEMTSRDGFDEQFRNDIAENSKPFRTHYESFSE